MGRSFFVHVEANKKLVDMKAFHITANTLGDILLYWVILFANIDYNGILDYAIKALVGGGIWFFFKVAGDYYSRKIKSKTLDTNE